MDLLAFYRAVLPSHGSYALFLGKTKSHVWCESLEALVEATDQRSQTPDVYFATASFDGHSRKADNALFRRAFCFDIDAGPEKFAKHGDTVYESQRDALAAVVRWCQSNRLAPRFIISSGAGLHVYFALDDDVGILEWKPVAEGLKAMAIAQGLRIDPVVTADAARVLRPPGTLHHSGASVTVLSELPASYTLADMAARVASFAPRKRERATSINTDITDAPIGPPKSIEKIIAHCAAVRHVAQVGGDVPEPYWRGMLGLVKFTVEGRDAAHQYSSGHPDYDPDDTDAKFDRWDKGPATCALFEAENPSACAQCPHRGKIKSPILLGDMTVQAMEEAGIPQPEPPQAQPFEGPDVVASDAEPWDPYMPSGFSIVRHDGCYFIKRKHKQEETDPVSGQKVIKILDTPFSNSGFWVESWAPGADSEDQAQFVVCVPRPGHQSVTRYTLPVAITAKRDTLLNALAAQNVQVYPLNEGNKGHMHQYIAESLARIRAAGQRTKVSDRFGTMHDDYGRLVVAQGRYMIFGDGTISEVVVSDKLRQRGGAYCIPVPPSLSGRWGPEVWNSEILPRARRHIEYLQEFYADDNFLPYQLAIMLAWASPMLAFMQGSFHPGSQLPGMGLTVSLYSPMSGIGKTAAMHAAALAFGIPNNICLQLDRNNATDNARQGLLLQSGTMPSFMDEMEDVEAADIASLISSVGNGASKVRMRKDLALSGGSPISLVNVMSTNKSHRELAVADRNESSAVQMRLLEIECSGVATVTAKRAAQEAAARAAIADCAGAVGAVIHLSMCALGSDTLNKLGLECANTAREMLDGRQDGRFMWRALGAMLAVRRMLKSHGLQVFDGKKLQGEFKRWHDAGYEFASERVTTNDAVELMSMMLSEMVSQTIITTQETPQIGPNARQDVILNAREPENALARSVLDGMYVYVKCDAIRDWCAKKRIGLQGTLARVAAANIFEPTEGGQLIRQVDLYKGTRLAQGIRVRCYKIRLSKLNPDLTARLEGEAGIGNVRSLRRAG